MLFYDELKDLRKRKGFTIREVSSRSGVSAAYISQLENGQRSIPSPDILLKLSSGLESSYTDLMRIAGYLEAPDSSSIAEPEAWIDLRRFIREHDIQIDGKRLTSSQKEWLDQLLGHLFSCSDNR